MAAQLRSAVVLGGACSCHGQLITIHRTETAATAATAATQRRRAMTAISEKMRPNAPRSTCLPGTPRQKVESILAASRRPAARQSDEQNGAEVHVAHTQPCSSVHITAHSHITICSARAQDKPSGPERQRATIWLSTAGCASATRLPRTQASHMLRGRRCGCARGQRTHHMAREMVGRTQTTPTSVSLEQPLGS